MKYSPEEAVRWMGEAIRLAGEAGARDEVPIGAVLVQEGKILASGANARETSHRTTAHAEIEALTAFNVANKTWRLPPGTSLFVTIAPCLMCTGALLWARLENIYYGCPDPRNAGLSTQLDLIRAGRFDHKFAEVESGVEADRCSALITNFFRRKR